MKRLTNDELDELMSEVEDAGVSVSVNPDFITRLVTEVRRTRHIATPASADFNYKCGCEGCRRLLEGTAAQLYLQSRGFWWHLVREDVRDEWRTKALLAINTGVIAGKD